MPRHVTPGSDGSSEPGLPDRLRPLHVVMTVLVVAIVAGGSLLLSAESGRHMEGAVPWHAESLLRSVVQLLSLNYQFPTVAPGEVKNYLLGIGAGLALIVLGVAIAIRDRGPSLPLDPSPPADDDAAASGDLAGLPRTSERAHIAPLLAAQVLFVLYVLWSFASSRWSPAPDLAISGSLLLAIQFLWSLALGNALHVRAVRVVSRSLIVVSAVTAAVAVWYYYGRNPVLRAMFPFGNPNFLSTALLPGLILAAALVAERLTDRGTRTRPATVAIVIAAIVAIVVCLWALYLAGSRGPAAALVFGLIGCWFFAAKRRAKLVPAGLAMVIALAGWLYVVRAASTPSPTGRDATLRFRVYAWGYAWRMFMERPFTGYGQGGFALNGDSYAVNDVLRDPQVFEARIAHAHSEWLEVLADLGSVGIVLVAAALLLTLRAGMLARDDLPRHTDRWVLIGLMGSLVALCVEEAFGVGLRVTGVPTWFYTTLGLTWASAGSGTRGLADYMSATRARRIGGGAIGIAVGLVALTIVQRDWEAARHAYRADELYRNAEYDEALVQAQASTSRLSPQRVLVNLFRLCELHLVKAEALQSRALDAEQRGRAAEPINTRLLAVAAEDFQLSDAHCKAASHELKELVSRSRGFINQGYLEYAINLARARNSEARVRLKDALPGTDSGAVESDPLAVRNPFLKYAADALKRELLRQPFNPQLTLDYINIANLTLDEIIDYLARPLRHNRMPPAYPNVLASLASQPEFDTRFLPIIRAAGRAVATSPPLDETGQPIEVWAPEKLRLFAVVAFLQGDLEAARTALEDASAAYATLASPAPMGRASAYAELADCRYFSNPLEVRPPLEAAQRAVELAPESRLGRELAVSVRRRMVDYYLAGDRREQAEELLRELAPADTAEELITAELARRYVRLGRSMVQRQALADVGNRAMALRRRAWTMADRALELDPDDPAVHAFMAELAIVEGNGTDAVAHLRRALDTGLTANDARELLDAALERLPQSEELKAMRHELNEPPEASGDDALPDVPLRPATGA